MFPDFSPFVILFFCKVEKKVTQRGNEKIHFAWRVQNIFCVLTIRSNPLPTMHFHKHLLLQSALKQFTVSFTDEPRFKFQACKPSPQKMEKIKGTQHKGQTSDLYCS